MRNRWTVAAVTALLLGLPTSAVQADSTDGVPVPRHGAPQVELFLNAGSDAGFVASMASPGPNLAWSFLIGTPGGRLHKHEFPASSSEIGMLNMIGQDAGYVIVRPHKTSTSTTYTYQIHRLNLVTGVDTNFGTVDRQPLVFTDDSWISRDGDEVISTPLAGGASTRIAALGGIGRGRIQVTDGALLINSTNADRSQSYLDLVDFASKSVRRVATEKVIYDFSVSPTTVAWVTTVWKPGKPMTVKVLSRSGGTPFVYSEADGDEAISDKVAGNNSIGYVLYRNGVSRLRTISTSGLVSTVPLPDNAYSLTANGSGWLFTASSRIANAGVYSVEGSSVDRQATVPPPSLPMNGLAFTAGRLYYTDNSDFDDGESPLGLAGPMTVWSRPVTGTGPPKLGPESELAQRTAHLSSAPDRSMAFSAGRGVVSGVVTQRRYTWRILDRGRTTAIVHQPYAYQPPGQADVKLSALRLFPADAEYPNLSGPYLVTQGHVFNPAGAQVYSQPSASVGAKTPATGNDDLFGPRLIYTRAVHGSDIWLRDLDRPKSPTNPVKIAHTNRPLALVSIWGNTVAWQSGARQISLRNLDSQKVRRIPTSSRLLELTLGEGILSWNSGDHTYLLNTLSADSQRMALPGSGRSIRLDDHYLARLANNGTVVAYRTPFMNKYRPRLIGLFAPKGTTWKPQFDLTKPVKDVRLVIRSAKTGSILRTLTGTGPDGSIRDLAFDGRNAKGRRLAAGTYRWQLLANAKDGEGALIGIRGERQVTGTMTIGRSLAKRS